MFDFPLDVKSQSSHHDATDFHDPSPSVSYAHTDFLKTQTFHAFLTLLRFSPCNIFSSHYCLVTTIDTLPLHWNTPESPALWEAKPFGSQVQVHPGQLSEPLSQNKT